MEEKKQEVVYVVFPGMPVQFTDLDKAQEFAAKLCLTEQSKRATVMSVDKFYADHSLTAVAVGVVIHATESLDNPFIDKQWEDE